MKLHKWMARLSVLSLIIGSSSMLQAESEYTYHLEDADDTQVFDAQFPADWNISSEDDLTGLLDY